MKFENRAKLKLSFLWTDYSSLYPPFLLKIISNKQVVFAGLAGGSLTILHLSTKLDNILFDFSDR